MKLKINKQREDFKNTAEYTGCSSSQDPELRRKQMADEVFNEIMQRKSTQESIPSKIGYGIIIIFNFRSTNTFSTTTE